jgi:hypothetical protein
MLEVFQVEVGKLVKEGQGFGLGGGDGLGVLGLGSLVFRRGPLELPPADALRRGLVVCCFGGARGMRRGCCGKKLLEGGHHRAVVAEEIWEDGGLRVHGKVRGGEDVIRAGVGLGKGHLSVSQQRVSVEVSYHGVVKQFVGAGVVEVTKEDDMAWGVPSEGVDVVGQSCEGRGCCSGVVYIGVNDQCRSQGGGQNLKVVVAVITDELGPDGVAREEGAAYEDCKALSS